MQKVVLTEKTKPMDPAKIKAAQQQFLDWSDGHPHIRHKFTRDGRMVTFYEDRDVTTFCMSYPHPFRIHED